MMYQHYTHGVADYDWSKWPEGQDKFALTKSRGSLPPLTDTLKATGAKYADKIFESRDPEKGIKKFLEDYTVGGEAVSGTPERFAVYYAINHKLQAAPPPPPASDSGQSGRPGPNASPEEFAKWVTSEEYKKANESAATTKSESGTPWLLLLGGAAVLFAVLKK